MGNINCRMCGSNALTFKAGGSFAVCEACGSLQTVTAVSEEKIIELYNRANRLRMNADFDRAASFYEMIIKELPGESEAYWGLCLCKYGVEYVESKADGTRKPTVHRASFDRMRNDSLYEAALRYAADGDAGAYYRAQAEEIDRITGEILQISRNEKPYDIFISYKETDNSNNRTPDSVLAQDIYTALTQKGYNVFFSRITLQGKLGTQYEPCIFAALNSAKLMLAVGTDYEFLISPWVRNEWSRFIKLMENDSSKCLVPCIKDMPTEDIPEEFTGFGLRDMGGADAVLKLLSFVDEFFGRRGSSSGRVQTDTAVENGSVKDYLLPDYTLYSGELSGGKPHGYGKCINLDGSIYSGNWESGKYNGKGTLTFSDGESWSGEWKNGEKMTGSGKIIYYENGKPNGDYYTGEFKDGKRNGKGIMTYADGDTWKGEWKDDSEWTGFGKEVYYKDGKRTGGYYIGELLEGYCIGQGVVTYADGDTWEGEWKNHKKWNGHGKIIYKKDGEPTGGYYIGEIKEGVRCGHGMSIGGSGTLYSGEWKDDKYNGKGAALYADGDMYSGEWKDGERSGDGIYIWTDGSKYSGEWRQGKRDGQGTYYFETGKPRAGIWKNNIRLIRKRIRRSHKGK